MNTHDVLKSLTENEKKVPRRRFGLETEEKSNDQADRVYPPVDDGGDEGGGVPAPADPPE